MTTTTSNKKQPVEHVRLGLIQAAIWRNEDAEGRVRYAATFDKRYRDGKGDWQSTGSYGRDELLVLAQAALKANLRIYELQEQDREESRQTPANGARAKATRGGRSR